MAFLFPISRDGKKYFRKNKFTSAVIFINREVVDRVNRRIEYKNIRNVNRVHPNIEYGSSEYFTILRNMLPIYSFYCDKTKSIINIDYCLTECRFNIKKMCKLLIQGAYACLSCDTHVFNVECHNFSVCEKRKCTIRNVSLYFSELMKLKKVIYMMRYGKGYKKNYRGSGPQLYFNVGKVTSLSPNRSFKRSNKIAIHMYKKRQKIAKKLRKQKGAEES